MYKIQSKSESSMINAVLGLFENTEQKLMKKPGRVLFGSSIIVVIRKRQPGFMVQDPDYYFAGG